MNREKEDQLPLMQVGFIDSICLPIYEVSLTEKLANTQTSFYIKLESTNFFFLIFFQAFSTLSDTLNPLVNGVRQNKNYWLELSNSRRNNSQNSTTIVTTPTNNNNNTIASDENNIASNDISLATKIVGKLANVETQIIKFNQLNGSIVEPSENLEVTDQ